MASEGPAPAVHRRLSAPDCQGSRQLHEARRVGRAVAPRGFVQLAPGELAAPARAGRACSRARAQARTGAQAGRSAREAAGSGEPPPAAQGGAGGHDHLPPKKSCRDPGDPPETPRHRRDRLMVAIEAVTTIGATTALCRSVGLARATLYRRRRPPRSSAPSAALVPAERQAVLDVLHSERFVDQSPAEVQATLLEEQTYLCSTRTMYRILDAAQEVRERRDQARHPAYAKPELVATAPNQIWSWDITKLKGPIPYLYYSLYVILDLFSRYVVGWMVATHENARLAQRLIEATCRKQRIGPHQITIHADRGAPMRSKLLVDLFSALCIDASHSRPRASNDNPFSEA